MRSNLLLPLLVVCSLGAAEPACDPVAMQAAMEQMTKTGAEHAALARAVGTWDVQSSMWMAPGAPPVVSKASATFSQILGGKWLRQDYQGDMMGQPYVGQSTIGYDTMTKQYVATWIDGFSTGMMVMAGKSSDGGKTITWTSEMPFCPMTGGPIAMRYVEAWASADHMTFTMFQTPKGGTESKSMELVYSRRAAK